MGAPSGAALGSPVIAPWCSGSTPAFGVGIPGSIPGGAATTQVCTSSRRTPCCGKLNFMAKSKAESVDEYLAELTEDRRAALATVRQVILDNLPHGYDETMQYGMIGYVVPLERYPVTYNGQALSYAALASQKNYMSLYLMNIYCDGAAERWFVDRYHASGKRLDMGKACVRFKKLEDLPIDLVGDVIALTPVAQFIDRYEATRTGK